MAIDVQKSLYMAVVVYAPALALSQGKLEQFTTQLNDMREI